MLTAQQNRIWYFGDKAGLDFGVQPAPGTQYPSALNNSSMTADEGCSSICDDAGNLLFYTNGVTVYNKAHQVMMNGNNIGGHISAFQSGVIVQHPGNKNLFYVFTADAYENNFLNGYRYATIDIAGDNGNGVVLTKNNILSLNGTEKIAACRHSNGSDVWVITADRNSNTFRSWRIDCNGLQPNATISQAGEVLNQYQTISVGVLKCSPDGTQICQTHFPDFDLAVGTSPYSFFQLYDFNAGTGEISNAKKILTPLNHYISCEYSPNSAYLYLSSLQGISQANCKLYDAVQISSSLINISTSPSIYGMQLGPDEKLYLCSPGNSLDVIEKPNNPGILCDYKRDKIILAGSAKLGLPNCINDISHDPYNNFTYQITDSCSGIIQFNGIANANSGVLWNWDFGNGNTSAIQNPIHTFGTLNTRIKVKLTISYVLGCRTILKAIEKSISDGGVYSKPNFRFFGGCDSGYIRFEIINPVDTNTARKYIWDFGDGSTSVELNPRHTYPNSSTYIVKLKLKTSTACLDDSVSIPVNMGTLSGTATISADQTIFPEQKIQLFASGPGNHFEWMPTTGLDDPHIAAPKASPASTTVYKVRISNDIGCFVERSVTLTVLELNEIYVPTGFTPNNDGKNDILIPMIGRKFTLKEFSIFNRWGQKIFTTNTKGTGWDGKQKGLVSSSGVFIWTLRATDETGKLIEKKGNVVLLQ